MIDFIKLHSNSLSFSQSIQNNELLPLERTFRIEKNGLLIYYYSFNGLEFKCFNSGRTEISGSLHKFYNKGLHNHNDFGFYELKETIYKLADYFGSEILEAKIDNLEFGLNINPTFKIESYINSIMVYHSKGIRPKQPITKDDLKGFDRGVCFILNEYKVKIYNKTQQYEGAKANTLRVEFRTKKMKFIKDAEIVDLVSLTDETRLDKLRAKLIKVFYNVLNSEEITNSIGDKDKLFYLQYSNPYALFKLSSPARLRHVLKRFKALKTAYCELDRKIEIIELLNEKYECLEGTFCPSI